MDQVDPHGGGADLVVDEFKIARRLIFPHTWVTMKPKPRASDWYIHCFDPIRLLRSRVHKDLVPVNLQVGRNPEPLGPGRELSRQIGDSGSREAGGETHIIHHSNPSAVCVHSFEVWSDRINARLPGCIHRVRHEILDVAIKQQTQRASLIGIGQFDLNRMQLREPFVGQQIKAGHVAPVTSEQ